MVKSLPAMQEAWVRSLGQEDPLEKEWQTTPVFLPGKSHAWRSLAGSSPWDHKESDTTERLHFHFSFVTAFFPRSKCLLISWLQLPSTVILEPKKVKSVTVSTFSSSVCHEVMGQDVIILVFWMLNFKPAFPSPLSPSSRGSLDPLCFLPLEWYHLCIWGCWYFSQQSWFQLVIYAAWHFPWCTLHIS